MLPVLVPAGDLRSADGSGERCIHVPISDVA